MKKLIEALHVIQDECKSHEVCRDCPMYLPLGRYHKWCMFGDSVPEDFNIDEVQKALLRKEQI